MNAPSGFLARRVPSRSNREIRAYTYAEVLDVMESYASEQLTALVTGIEALVREMRDKGPPSGVMGPDLYWADRLAVLLEQHR
jgi:hypothetical protein